MSRFLIASVVAAAVLGVPAHGDVGAPAPPAAAMRGRRFEARNLEQRYRIVGKVRLLLFWIGADDVGGARVTWRARNGDQHFSLIIGSDPARAPRSVNEWGYVREAVAGDTATVFGIRTETDGASPDDVEAQRQNGRLAEFGVLCSSVGTADSLSRTTTVFAPRDATYHHVDRILDVVEGQTRWNRRHAARPPGVAVGFLSALDLMLRSGAASADGAGSVPDPTRLAYVYKDVVYDLTARRVERVAELKTHAGVFRNLLRTEFTVRSRATGWATGFEIAYGTEGALAGIPVHARYQPNWWFRVELELDDAVDVPADPADDPSTLRRIETICASSTYETTSGK